MEESEPFAHLMIVQIPRHSSSISGLSWAEVLIVVGVLMLLALLFLPAIDGNKTLAPSTVCLHNQKQLVLACITWANDNDQQFPFASTNAGGSRAFVDSPEVFRHYLAASNELVTPRILICPTDKRRKAAENFGKLSNANLSYFVGIDATPLTPNALLSGDRNVTADITSNRFLLRVWTNTPITWTTALHQNKGNVGLADGSAQRMTTAELQEYVALRTNNPFRLAIP